MPLALQISKQVQSMEGNSGHAYMALELPGDHFLKISKMAFGSFKKMKQIF
jgi:hypothetical protein